jgi:hypothetical protein
VVALVVGGSASLVVILVSELAGSLVVGTVVLRIVVSGVGLAQSEDVPGFGVV